MEPKKVLVVDDSKLMHQMYAAIFEHLELIHAFDGRDALERLAEHADTDLVLVDINMPRMNGLEFLGEARANPIFSRIPILIVSTEGSEQDTLRGLQNGASGYVRKPFDAETLFGVIGKLPELRK